MNNNEHQFSEQNGYTQQTVAKNAAYYRQKAREALKDFWWTAILVTLVASLLGGVAIGSVNIGTNFGGAISSGNITDDEFFEDEGYEDEDSIVLTDEQSQKLTEAFATGDFSTVSAILSEADPMFNVVFAVIGIIFLMILCFALALVYFIGSPIKVGYHRFFLELIDGNNAEIRVGTLFRFFKQGYLKTVGLNFMYNLIMSLTMLPFYILTGIGVGKFFTGVFAVAFLENPADEIFISLALAMLSMVGLMLLGLFISIIINIPVSYMYSMAHTIMADYPGVGVFEALRSSRNMMKGNKWRLFCLDFSFIGWALLGVCACGLGSYAVTPYQYAARAAFYADISGRKTPEDVEFPSINPEDYIIE